MRTREIAHSYRVVIAFVVVLWVFGFLGVWALHWPLWTELATTTAACLLLFHSFGIITRAFHYFVSGALLIGIGSFLVSFLRYFRPTTSAEDADVYQMLANIISGLTTAAGACALFEGMRKRRRVSK